MAVPQYRILWIGSLFASLAFMMSFTAQSVVAFELEGTNKAVGVVGVGMGAAMLVLGPFGGVIADRVSKRRLLLVGQGVTGLSFVAVGLLIVSGQITLLWLAAGTAVMGLSFAFVGPGRQAYVGAIVPPRLLANAVALSQLSMSMTRIVAPLLAGLLIGLTAVGAGGTYIFMGALFVFVLATVGLLPEAPSRGLRRSIRSDFVAGLRHVTERPRLRLLAFFFIAMVVLGFGSQTVMPALLENELGHPARDIGMLFTVSAISGLAVGLWLAGMVSSRWAWPLMYAMCGIMGLSMLLLAAAPSYELALATMVLAGPGLSGFMLMNNSLLMAEASPEYFGRVMSLMSLGFGFQSLSGLPVGALADAIGERTTLVGNGLIVIALAVVAYFIYLAIRRRERAVAPPPVAIRAAPVALSHIAVMAAQKSGQPIVQPQAAAGGGS